ncbi:MAG: hypothetical protein ACYCPW_06355, partial [Nitrososphaerales archaeon]
MGQVSASHIRYVEGCDNTWVGFVCGNDHVSHSRYHCHKQGCVLCSEFENNENVDRLMAELKAMYEACGLESHQAAGMLTVTTPLNVRALITPENFNLLMREYEGCVRELFGSDKRGRYEFQRIFPYFQFFGSGEERMSYSEGDKIRVLKAGWAPHYHFVILNLVRDRTDGIWKTFVMKVNVHRFRSLLTRTLERFCRKVLRNPDFVLEVNTKDGLIEAHYEYKSRDWSYEAGHLGNWLRYGSRHSVIDLVKMNARGELCNIVAGLRDRARRNPEGVNLAFGLTNKIAFEKAVWFIRLCFDGLVVKKYAKRRWNEYGAFANRNK